MTFLYSSTYVSSPFHARLLRILCQKIDSSDVPENFPITLQITRGWPDYLAEYNIYMTSVLKPCMIKLEHK